MAKSNKLLSQVTIFGVVFSVLFHLHAGMIARNVGPKEGFLAVIFFFIPVVYAVYYICVDRGQMPRFIKRIALFGASFLFLNEMYNFMVDLMIIIGRESLAYSLWPYRLIPLALLFVYTLVIGRINFKYARNFFIVILGFQLFMIGYLMIDHIIYVSTNAVGTVFFVETAPYILSMLNVSLPFCYLVFFDFNEEKFERPYLSAIVISIIIMAIFYVFANGSHVEVSFNFENSYYLDSLYLNNPPVIAYLFAFLKMIIRLFVAGFVYTIVCLKVNQDSKSQAYASYIINTLLLMVVFKFLILNIVVDFQQFVLYQFKLGVFIQMVYVIVLVYYGFFVALRKYELTRIKTGLYLFPSFLMVYLIYNMSKYSPELGNAYFSFLNAADDYLLIFSLFIFLYYTFETMALWYAYSHKQSTLDVGEVVVNKQLEIYVMIPCMNEEIVIANTLDSLLASEYERLNLVVIDDASIDRTAEIVRGYNDSRLRLIKRVKPEAQLGKGEALNYVYQILQTEIHERKLDPNDVLITIIDADTNIPNFYFEKVNYVFNARPELTGLQSKVRVISKSGDSSQDLEFAEIINASQSLRSLTNTVAFGGNGQFCKLAALESLDELPWSRSLVEDFDLSTRLFLNKKIDAKHAQYTDIYITQSGIDNDPAALVKQRVRWSQGNIQSVKYIIPIIRSKHLQVKQKTELLLTLIKPWLMGIEYVIVIYTLVTLVDIFILGGMSQVIAIAIALFLAMMLYIFIINLVWAILYNRNKIGKTKVKQVFVDCYNLSKFLVMLSQIYPQSMIRYFKRENGWDKTNRQK